MIRANNGLHRAVGAAVLAWTAIVIAGMLYLVAYNPATELDRKCLKSSLAEMQQCIDDYHREQGR